MIRKLAVRAVQALALGAVLGVGLSPAYAATGPVRVPADAGWVNTGVLVVEGQTVYLDTEGVAITGPLADFPGARSGPDGQVWNLGCGEYAGAPPPCALNGAPYGALVGKVGESGEPFLIGGASSFTPPASGYLYLAVNDNLIYYSDNQAGFTVLIATTPVVRVPADAEWVNSEILVVEGQIVYLNTEGMAITAPRPDFPVSMSGPDGQTWNLGCGEYEGAPPPCAMNGAPYGALVGKVGESGTPFLIGDASWFIPSASGDLYLAVNDNLGFYDDNQAGFTVLFNNPGAIVELELMGWASSPAESTRLQEVIDTFNAQHPTIHVTMNLVPDYDGALDARFASGTPPDVFYVDSFRLPDLAQAGWLAVGGDLIQMPDDFYPSLREAFTYQGDFYCPPKDFSTLALVYNSDMFEAAGVGVPTTWEELQSAAEALTDTEAGIYGLVLPVDSARWIAFLYLAGGSMTDPDFTYMTINSPEGATALEYYTNFVRNGSAATPSQVDAGWAGEALGQQKAAMVIEGNWIVPYLRDFFPDVNFGVAELPAGPAGQATMAFTVCYAVPANAGYPEESWILVNWLTGVEGMQQWTDLGLAMPSRESLRDHWLALFPELEPFLNGAAYAHEWQFVPGFGDVVATVDDNIQRIFDGTQTVEGALEEIEAVGNGVLGFEP